MLELGVLRLLTSSATMSQVNEVNGSGGIVSRMYIAIYCELYVVGEDRPCMETRAELICELILNHCYDLFSIYMIDVDITHAWDVNREHDAYAITLHPLPHSQKTHLVVTHPCILG